MKNNSSIFTSDFDSATMTYNFSPNSSQEFLILQQNHNKLKKALKEQEQKLLVYQEKVNHKGSTEQLKQKLKQSMELLEKKADQYDEFKQRYQQLQKRLEKEKCRNEELKQENRHIKNMHTNLYQECIERDKILRDQDCQILFLEEKIKSLEQNQSHNNTIVVDVLSEIKQDHRDLQCFKLGLQQKDLQKQIQKKFIVNEKESEDEKNNTFETNQQENSRSSSHILSNLNIKESNEVEKEDKFHSLESVASQNQDYLKKSPNLFPIKLSQNLNDETVLLDEDSNAQSFMQAEMLELQQKDEQNQKNQIVLTLEQNESVISNSLEIDDSD